MRPSSRTIDVARKITELRTARAGLLALIALALSAAAVAEVAGDQEAAAVSQPSTADPTSARAEKPRAPRATSRQEIRRLIDKVARRHGVEAALVHAVVAAESAYNTHAVSTAGAVGLMQLMPATAQDYGVSSRDALFHAPTNVDAGVRHLKRLLRKYRGDYGRVIMAYNAGEGVVDRTNNNVRFRETLDYTEAVVRRYRQLGGSQPTAHVLQKVSALRRPGKSKRPDTDPAPPPEPVGLLPRASPQLQAGLPKAPLDAVSPLAAPAGQGRLERGQRGAVVGAGPRASANPGIPGPALTPAMPLGGPR